MIEHFEKRLYTAYQCITENLDDFKKERHDIERLREENRVAEQALQAQQRIHDVMTGLIQRFTRNPSRDTFLALNCSGYFPENKNAIFLNEYDHFLQALVNHDVCEQRVARLKIGHEAADIQNMISHLQAQLMAYQKKQSEVCVSKIVSAPVAGPNDLNTCLLGIMKDVSFFKEQLYVTLEAAFKKSEFAGKVKTLLALLNSDDLECSLFHPNSRSAPIYVEIKEFLKSTRGESAVITRFFDFVTQTVPSLFNRNELSSALKKILSHNIGYRVNEILHNVFHIRFDFLMSSLEKLWLHSHSTCDRHASDVAVEAQSDYQRLKVSVEAGAISHDFLRRQLALYFSFDDARILEDFLVSGYSLKALSDAQKKRVALAETFIEYLRDDSKFSKTKGAALCRSELADWMSAYHLDVLRSQAAVALDRSSDYLSTLEAVGHQFNRFVKSVCDHAMHFKAAHEHQMECLRNDINKRRESCVIKAGLLDRKEHDMLQDLKAQVASVFESYQKKDDVHFFEKFYYKKTGLKYARELHDAIQSSTNYVAAANNLKRYFSQVGDASGLVKLRNHSLACRLLMVLFDDERGVFNKNYLDAAVAAVRLPRSKTRISSDIQKASTTTCLFFQNSTTKLRVVAAQEAVKIANTQIAHLA